MSAAFDPKKPNKGKPRKELRATCLESNFSEKQLEGLQEILNKTGWFSIEIILAFFFNNKSKKNFLPVKEEYFKFAAYFFYRMGKEFLIKADRGKGFIVALAMRIRCGKKKMSAAQINKICTEITSNQTKYELLLATVEQTIAKVMEMKAKFPNKTTLILFLLNLISEIPLPA